MTEFDRAREWRTANRYTKRLLSEKTGFSISSIDAFEAGENRNGQPVDARAFKRYRLCCAAVGAGLDGFDW
jgi:transcriptional regulator with XRE-family HTH domain